MVDAVFQALRDKIDTRTPEQVEFLQALVRAATDIPPEIAMLPPSSQPID